MINSPSAITNCWTGPSWQVERSLLLTSTFTWRERSFLLFFYGERSPTLPFSHSKRFPHSHPVTTLPSPSCTKDSMSVTGLLLNIPLVTSILIPLDVVTILQKLMCRSPLFMIKVREMFLLMLSIPGGDKGWV